MSQLLSVSPVIPYIVLVIGFILLVKGADYFVEGCSGIAKLFHIPTIIIGLTVAAFGTSAPEAAVSITSSLKGANAMAVSNVVGSNIFNLLIVVGLCAVIKPVKVTADIIKRDYPVCISVTVLMILFSTGFFLNGFKPGTLNRVYGIILLILFISYLAILVNNTLKNRKELLENDDSDTGNKISVPKCLFFIAAGLTAIALGGDFVVDSASEIARSLGMTETLIGLTIVAFGTSLPELVTSIVASKKGENDLAVGNVVGSNIFNILFVLGMAAAVCPIDLSTIINPMFTLYDMIILLIVTVIVNIFILIKRNINRLEGALMVIMYASYMAYIIIR